MSDTTFSFFNNMLKRLVDFGDGTYGEKVAVAAAPPETEDATIADSATNSSSVACGSRLVAGFMTDADIDGTAISIDVSQDGSTWVPYADPDDGSDRSFTITATTAKFYGFDPPKLFALPYIRFVAGTAQTNATTIIVIYAP